VEWVGGVDNAPAAGVIRPSYVPAGGRTMPLAKATSARDSFGWLADTLAERRRMSGTLFQAASRQEIQQRLARLSPDRAPRWGRFNAPRMVVHLADSIRMAFGELSVAPKATPLRYPILKQFAIYVAPWPRGSATSPELLARAPAAWNGEIVTLSALVERFSTRSPAGKWPRHPLFGSMTGRAWGVLAYRHCDHHFRQFGI
jgi:hypothetical protein